MKDRSGCAALAAFFGVVAILAAVFVERVVLPRYREARLYAAINSGDVRTVAQRLGQGVPVEGRYDESVVGPEVVEGLLQLLTLGVLAGLLVVEDPLTVGCFERGDLPVEELTFGADACVADEGAPAPDWVEEILGVKVHAPLSNKG